LAERGTRAKPGRIIQEVAGALDEASTSRTAEDPTLILVGHSLGGIIAYDLLSYYRPKIKVDVFASVGSQIGLLEEIKVLKASDKTIGQDRDTKVVPRLKNIGRWINVYDLNDPASFSTSKIFSDSTDYLYTTGLAPRPAHSGYWIRPSFYERLADRVSQP
jgi:surfactin synthase thioesterase subunit